MYEEALNRLLGKRKSVDEIRKNYRIAKVLQDERYQFSSRLKAATIKQSGENQVSA